MKQTGINVIMPSEVSDEMKKNISNWLLSMDSRLTFKDFELVLSQLGIDSTEKVYLRPTTTPDIYNFSTSGIDAETEDTIQLIYGKKHESYPKIIVHESTQKRMYTCYDSGNNYYFNKMLRAKLTHYNIRKGELETGPIELTRSFEKSRSYTVELINGNDVLNIFIKGHSKCRADEDKPLCFSPEVEESINNYLLGIEFPINIIELYKEVCQILGITSASVPIFDIVHKEISADGKLKLKNAISFRECYLSFIVVTNGDTTVSRTLNGNYKYTTPGKTISKNFDGYIVTVLEDGALNQSDPNDPETTKAKEEADRAYKLGQELYKYRINN